MHLSSKREVQTEGRKAGGKAIVMGMLERGGVVRTAGVEDRTKRTMQPIVAENVETGSEVMSDEWASNWRKDDMYTHQVINHLETCVQGNVQTSGMENFWILLKRSIHGTNVAVEPFHLFRYADEQAWRFNNRNLDDVHRFVYGMHCVDGRRLTYAELTGKVGDACHGRTANTEKRQWDGGNASPRP